MPPRHRRSSARYSSSAGEGSSSASSASHPTNQGPGIIESIETQQEGYGAQCDTPADPNDRNPANRPWIRDIFDSRQQSMHSFPIDIPSGRKGNSNYYEIPAFLSVLQVSDQTTFQAYKPYDQGEVGFGIQVYDNEQSQRYNAAIAPVRAGETEVTYEGDQLTCWLVNDTEYSCKVKENSTLCFQELHPSGGQSPTMFIFRRFGHYNDLALVYRRYLGYQPWFDEYASGHTVYGSLIYRAAAPSSGASG